MQTRIDFWEKVRKVVGEEPRSATDIAQQARIAVPCASLALKHAVKVGLLRVSYRQHPERASRIQALYGKK